MNSQHDEHFVRRMLAEGKESARLICVPRNRKIVSDGFDDAASALERLVAERDQAIRERDAAREECRAWREAYCDGCHPVSIAMKAHDAAAPRWMEALGWMEEGGAE